MAAGSGRTMGSLAIAVHQRIIVKYQQLSFLQIRNYAARKGTREKARKKKVKVEVKEVGFIPHNKRFKKRETLKLNQVRVNDTNQPEALDDVFIKKYHKFKNFPFEEAVQCHRETHHPTVFNKPDAFINAFLELDMNGAKPTKPVAAFSRTISVPCPFNHGEERKIIAFAKDPQLLDIAYKAGASMSGGKDLINKIQTGEISVNDYTAVVAHPEIMAELSIVRGIMKRKFPNPRTGTLGLDIENLIYKLLHGIKYAAIVHERFPLYGTITAPIGRLDTDVKGMEENLNALITDVETVRPKRDGPFITRVSLRSPPSKEIFKLNLEQYLKAEAKGNDDESDDDDEAEIRSNVI